MILVMHVEQCPWHKALVAYMSLVGSFACVVALCEWLAACFAWVGLLPCVGQVVHSEGRILGECFPTYRACAWLLTCVHVRAVSVSGYWSVTYHKCHTRTEWQWHEFWGVLEDTACWGSLYHTCHTENVWVHLDDLFACALSYEICERMPCYTCHTDFVYHLCVHSCVPVVQN
jgi:hypothetical protein